MSAERPPGIDCLDWKPREVGKKRCAFYLTPDATQGEVAAMCNLPKHFLCTEWEKANPGLIAAARLAAKQKTDPASSSIASKTASLPVDEPVQADLFGAPTPLPKPAPPSPPVAPPAPSPEPQGAVPIGFAPPLEQPRPSAPRPMMPAKEIPLEDIKLLEDLGAEFCLFSKPLNREVWLVAKKTGSADRFEMTFREAATLRLIVDSFPGVRVTQLITASEASNRSPQ